MIPGVTKERLWMAQRGRFELCLALDVRDLWIGVFWRRERYSGEWGWMWLWEFYVCLIPCLVFSVRFR